TYLVSIRRTRSTLNTPDASSSGLRSSLAILLAFPPHTQMKSKERLVRSYCSEGLPRRWYSQESAESLVKRKAVIAVRDRKGTLLSIHFYGESRVPIKNRLKAGTRYSYQELVG